MARVHFNSCRGFFVKLILMALLCGCGGGGSVGSVAPPTAAKVFSSSTIAPGGTSALTITLSNSNVVAITGVAFTDIYPSNVFNAATPNAGTTCTGGTITAAAGGGFVALAGGTVAAGGSCTVTVTVTSAVPGTYNNTIPVGGITTTNAGSNTGAVTATLTVSAPVPPSQLSLSAFVSGLTLPVDLQAPNDNSGRLFVVEQGGRIRIIQNGVLVPLPFLDITGKVFSPPGSEEGLLGLVFHPDYLINGRFFVNYVRAAGPTGRQSVIAEYGVTSTPNIAVPASERILLTVDQPFDNHKAGQLAFGTDGKLYIGFGDGGSGGDPFGNGQNTNTLLGKMLRIDIDSLSTPGKAYAIAPDNPFAGGGGLPEIWAYGLRNPWRFSFDRASGRMFCADVGQNRFEEINLIVRGGNYGWNITEGDACFNPATGCSTTGLLLPVTQYDHTEGTAVIGGYVYQGSSISGLVGVYVFGDLTGGKVWGLQQDAAGNWQRTLLLSHSLTVSSFGQDQSGELYLLDYGNGAVLRILGR